MTGYALLIPELLVLLAAFWALFAEKLPGGDRGAAWLGAVATLAAAVIVAVAPLATTGGPFPRMLAFDGPARLARIVMCMLAAVWLLWTAGRGQGRVREAVSLALFALIGGMLVAEARELVTLILAIELATMPAYVLIGYRRGDGKGLEGALKYFLMSMLTTLIMLYGFSFLYGLTGTTRYSGMDLKGAGTLGVLAVLFAVVGLLSKLSAAPFHYWAPDAYEGATPWAVAFVSTVPKVAGAVAIVRLVSAIAPGVPLAGTVLLVASVLSIVLGNLGALTQTDVRRMMAYSGVAHSGYLLLGVAALSIPGSAAAIFYALAYAIPSMGIMLITAEEGSQVADFGGMAQRRPATAWVTVIMLFSLIGIPPLVGFFGKLSVFTAALQRGFTAVVVLAVVMSVVSAAYYLRIVRAMFFAEEPAGHLGVTRNGAAATAIGVCVVAVVALGLAAGPLLASIGVVLR
ncbi:MAG: NADH-quinone oxidoreductase subunit N [Coriobacteriia bacterium]